MSYTDRGGRFRRHDEGAGLVGGVNEIVQGAPNGAAGASRARVRTDGKFFRLGDQKFWVKGVTYGPFAPREGSGLQLPEAPQLHQDFRQIRGLGANVIRVYHVPPREVLDLAHEYGLKVFVDVPWSKHRCFLENREDRESGRRNVREAARSLAGHPALFALSVVNELPPDVVRWLGPKQVERFVDELVDVAREQDPGALVTCASFPPTEYLAPRAIDFMTMNVYLHDRGRFGAYLRRLQNIAGEKPLILGEYGIDTIRNGEEEQAELIGMHLEEVFRNGLAGTCVFSYTDEWFTGGHPITDWAFGLVRRDRSPKPSFFAVAKSWRAESPLPKLERYPRMSVVVCTYNGSRTLDGCLDSLTKLNYPDYEAILVNDGSTDSVPEIAAKHPSIRYIAQPNRGLSVARNVGAEAATGEIVVYTDDDCFADPDWLYYLAAKFLEEKDAVAVGGPNLLPIEDGPVSACVQASPGAPAHILLDDVEAEHIPGCNMAFRRDALLGIGGFDPVYRKAGDDVDVCWRLQEQGGRIVYAPSAMVWHHRRTTVKAYLRQQCGYGEAEALLKRKHPEKFHGFRADLSWMGRIYTRAGLGLTVGEPAIHHGVFGTGFFQTIYSAPQVWWPLVALSLEWWALALGLIGLANVFNPAAALADAGVLGPWALSPFANPLVLLPSLMLLSTFALAWRASGEATPAEHQRRWWSRPLIAAMNLAQPVERGWARYKTRFQTIAIPASLRRLAEAWSQRAAAVINRDSLELWAENGAGRDELLARVLEIAHAHRWFPRVDSGWARHDARFYGDRWCKTDVITVTENHGGPKRLTKVRLDAQATLFQKVLFIALAYLTLVAAGLGPAALLALAPVVAGVAIVTTLAARRLRQAVNATFLEAARDLDLLVVGLPREKKAEAADGERDELPAAARVGLARTAR